MFALPTFVVHFAPIQTKFNNRLPAMKNCLILCSVLLFTVHIACKRASFSRPVKYVAYV
jgi:hypothetical protein